MEQWVSHLFEFYPHLVYAFIIFVSFIEGPILALFCGLLIKLGDAPFWPVYIALMAGDLVGDTVWYYIGFFFGNKFIIKFGKYFSVTEEGIAVVKRIFHKYHQRILIISKITMGFGFALVTLITAGIVKIPFRQYFILNFVGQFVWTAFLLFVGYMFGNLYLSLDNFLGKLSVIGMFITVIALMIGYGRYMKNKMTNLSK